ncbi:MAG: hypothetical protein KIT81_06925 [Alphaproteobacteria bacterium]|nr:hypothetical protein [Alphaproteobacteria bacterium]
MNKGHSTGAALITTKASRTSAALAVTDPVPFGKASTNDRAVDGAVYKHVQALRALGQKQVRVQAIARALSLSTREVDKAMRRLSVKGVRPVE